MTARNGVRNFFRLLRTVRYLSFRQIRYRALAVGRRRWWSAVDARCPEIRAATVGKFQPLWVGLRELPGPETLQQDVQRMVAEAEAVAALRFKFLGSSVAFNGDVDWAAKGQSHLWRYHLHYFGFARSLVVWSATTGSAEGFAAFRRLAVSWMNANDRLRGDGWHPYTISIRLVNWLQAIAHWADNLERDQTFRAALLSNTYGQARILRKQMEFDVRGNHLVENLRALLWAGTAFATDEAREWFRIALKVLEEETAEQVLADGGHFERTPGYHVVVMRDYLEIALMLERNHSCPAWLRDAVRRQAMFLQSILGTNRRLPLLKDTALDAAPDPDDLLNAAAAWLCEPARKGRSTAGLDTYLLLGSSAWNTVSNPAAAQAVRRVVCLRESGYYVFGDSAGEHVILDVGKPCPDYLPAHAHADTFNYEYSFGDSPVVVDSGVYAYQRGSWRDFFRSTRAHNTVEIDGQNSSEVWSNFRVGRRAHPKVLHEVVTDSLAALLCQHDGFRHLVGRPMHRRVFLWRRGEYFVVVDEVRGTAAARVASHIHFHPSLDPQVGPGSRWNIGVESNTLWLHHSDGMTVSRARGAEQPREQGWYSERFGRKEANTVLTFCGQGPQPFAVACVFSWREQFEVRLVRRETQLDLHLSSEDLSDEYVITASAIRHVA